jgi:hypothetical protein
MFLGSVYLCVSCYDHRNDKGWNKKIAWSLYYQRRKNDSLTNEQKQALKDAETERQKIKVEIKEMLEQLTPLDPSYWATTFDANKPKKWTITK